MTPEQILHLIADLLMGFTGLAVLISKNSIRRRKQCPICRKYYGDDNALAEEFQRCPECGISWIQQKKTEEQQKKGKSSYSYHKSAPVKSTLPAANIASASYLQYRTAYRESCTILSVFLVFCCFTPLLSNGASMIFHGTLMPWLLRYGVMMILMIAGICFRPLLEHRLALYYGLITRCAFCQKKFYKTSGFLPQSSSVSRILFAGKCPNCHQGIIR